MFSSFIHLPVHFKMSLLFPAVQYSIVQMYHIFFIHFSVKEHLCCFQVLAMTNNAVMNIGEHNPCGMLKHPLDIYPKVVLLSLEEGCFLIL